MSKQGVRFRRFVIPVVLSFLMLFTAMMSPSFAAAPNGTAKAASFGDKDPSEKITLLVALKERKREKRTGLPSVDAEDLNTRENIRAQVAYARAARETFYKSLKDAGIKYNVVETYDVAYTGVALEVQRKDIGAIEKMTDVASVEISQQFKAPKKPIMPRSFGKTDISSNNMVEANKAWKKSYAGKGSVIAVIDSGVDPYHEAMKLSDPNSGRIKSQGEVKKLIDDLDIARGDYFSSKIPFGYNYANKSTSIKEFDPMSHGMHVSGIVAGNSEKIQGVAPEAQIVFMRVFGGGVFGNGTSAEIYTKAIDDAIKLGVDSMNISIGSPAGTEDYVFPNTVLALEKAKQAGILVAIAAGNNGFFGYSPGSNSKPKAENPDIGMLADPSVSPNSLSVASIQNMKVAKKGIQLMGDDRVLSFQPTKIGKVTDQWVFLKDCGYGRPDDFKEQGNENTYALIERGEPGPVAGEPLSFADKINNARDKGYAGVIIYDNEPNMPLIQVEAPGTTIPAAFVNRKDGLYLKNIVERNPRAQIRFNDEYVYSLSEDGGQPSEFSSWGLTPNGNLKPDIAAPGGGILSSLNDNQYGVMDGTSMAAPHVAGGVALVKQRVEKDFSGIRGDKKYDLIKKLLMSTAQPYKYNDSGAYASPRQQGSGLMQVDKAITATAFIEGSHGLTSINLGKNLSGDKVTVPFKIVNLSDKAKTYTYYGVLNTDQVEGGKILLRPQKISESENKTVTVEAHESVELTVELPVTGLDKLKETMPNGFFLEGFVFCEEQGGVNLSAPFVGFHGNFDKLEIAETPLYDLVKANKRSYYYDKGGEDDYYGTNIGGEIDKNLIVLGAQAKSTKANPIFDKEKIAFSPNGDGRADKAIFMATFLRNYGGVEIAIRNHQGKLVYYSKNPEDHGVKNYFVDPRVGNMFANNMMTTKPHWQWNGTDSSGTPLPDGKYHMTVKVAAAGKSIGADSQVMEFPMTMDRVYPRVKKAYFNGDKSTYTIESIDENGSGILSVRLKKGKDTIEPKMENGKYVFDLKNIKIEDYEVEINDQARNDLRYPLTSGERTGSERSVRIKALVGNDPVPAEAFTWTVQSPDGKIEDPNNLSPGKHVLVVNVKDGNYKLIGEKTREFEIRQDELVKELEVRFVSVDTADVHISMTNPDNANVSLLIKNKDVEGQEYVPTIVNPSLRTIKLPLGNYTIDVSGIQKGYYAMVDGGEDFTVDSQKLLTKNVNVRSIESKELNVRLNRKGYEGGLRLKLIGQDVYRTEQNIEFAPGVSEKTVRLDFIPSHVELQDMEDGYYGLSKRSKTWAANSNASAWNVALTPLNEKDPNYVDKNELRALVAKAREALAHKSDYAIETEEDIRNWKYIDAYLPLVDQTIANDKASQDDVDKVCNNLREGLSKLRKKGESRFDQSKLEKAIKRAEGLKADDYTDESWKEVAKALNDAKAILQKPDGKKNQDVVDIAAMDLNEALDGLKRKDDAALVDKKVLEDALKAYREAQYKAEDYTPESFDRLELAVEAAEEIFNRPFPAQEDVNAAAQELTDAMAKLHSVTGKKEREAEREALKQELLAARELKESDYTPKSWLQLQERIAFVQKIADDENSSLDSLKHGRKTLKEAIDLLEKPSQEVEKTEIYELPFRALHASKDQESMAAGVFKSPAKVIKTTDKEGKVHYRVVVNCKVLPFGNTEGHLKDILFASSDGEGKVDAMPVIDKVTDAMGDLSSFTIDMDKDPRPEHFVKVKYVIGNGPGFNEDIMRLSYDIANMKKIEESEEKPPKVDDGLEKAKTALKEAIEKAEAKLAAPSYTAESKAKLEEAIHSAMAALEGNNASEINRAVTSVYNAMDQLVKETPKPEPTPDVPKPNPEPDVPTPKPTPDVPTPRPNPQPNVPTPKPNPVPKPNPWPRQEPRGESPAPSYRPSHQASAPEVKQPEVKQPEVKKEAPKVAEQKAHSFTVKAPEKAYVKGFPDGSFKPNKEVTRGEVAQILNQFIQNSDAYRLPKDVSGSEWYGNSVARLYGLSILNGYNDGNLRPEGSMTRAELAAIMTRVLNLKVDNARFNDVKGSAWYNGYVGAVQNAGIIQGYPDGTFGGERTVTRAELVVIVNRAFKVVGRPGTMQFNDVDANHWAYKEIQKAAN
ncbi:S8 family serine peptidase [Aedoeadaptatus acetigenes]|uniref:S8 family serine peptidase n=1 Tax=Aedoeadaptatus acetigenes TaxID=2981723 RepID=UPI0011DDD885|nr:S8 family serine peptidase [Aedoeadaptatus acetigenes]MCU6786021.1 S8 family serine peptidase [Aedoeadaptatus acetigenes]